MPNKQAVDVVVIGAGTAGLVAQRSASKAGAHAVLVDAGPLGTTCARVGCMPSKLLIAAAEAAHAIKAAPVFGVHAGPRRIDGPAVLARVRAERDRFVGFVLDDSQALIDRGLLVSGRARVVAADTLMVDDHSELKFRALVVATGSAPRIPAMFAELPGLLTNETVFELPDLPASVLVVGAGPIGLELGQALHRLGVRVTVVGYRGILGPLRDPDVKAAAYAALRREFELHTSYALERIAAGGDGVVMDYHGDDGQLHHGTWSHVLVAAGRVPQLQGLGLEHAGVRFDDRGQVQDFDRQTLRLGDTPVFLAGDVSGVRPLLHEASDEGYIAGAQAAAFPQQVTPASRRTAMSVVFTEPNLAVVGGGSEGTSRETHAVGAVRWDQQGRARVLAKNVGLTHIYARRSDGVLTGAEMVGPGAEHMAHLLAWSVQQGLTVAAALAMPFYHPVLEEGLRTALRALAQDLAATR